jgi:hypothetical protein
MICGPLRGARQRRIEGKANTVGLSNLMKYRVSRPHRFWPSALTIQRSRAKPVFQSLGAP